MAEPANKPGLHLARHYLGRHDIPCPKCGYSMRGLSDPRCPECGSEMHIAPILTAGYRRTLRRTRVRIALNLGLTACLFAVTLIGVRFFSKGDAQAGLAMLCPLGALAPSIAIAAAERRWAPGRDHPDIMLLSWLWIALLAGAMGFCIYSVIATGAV